MLLGSGLTILTLVLSVGGLTALNTFGWGGHVTWRQLGHFNVKTFERQFRETLPFGTPRSAVEAYLKREGIPFKYSEGSAPYFWIYRPNVDWTLLLFPGDLSVHVNLGKDDTVTGIDFTVKYPGFPW
jgi:hypothetical protein